MAKKEAEKTADTASAPGSPKVARHVNFIDEGGSAQDAVVMSIDKKTAALDLEVFPRGGQSYAAKAVVFNPDRAPGTWQQPV
jgi:hypothetical protein